MRLFPYRREIGWRSRATDAAVGALGVLGFAPFGLWPATLLCFALFLLRLREHTEPYRGTSTGFWTGMGWFGAGLFWIASAFFERGPEYVPLVVPLVLGLFVLLSLFWAWAGRVYVMIAPRDALAAPLFASLMFIAEFTRGHLFGGFPWNLPGYAWAAGSPMSQAASVIGVYGLSYLMMLAGGLLALAWEKRRARSPAFAGAALVLLAGLWGFGAWRLSGAEIEHVEGTRLRLVHVPFRQSEMMDPDTALGLTNRYFTATLDRPLDGVTHVVWPEGAVRGVAVDDLEFLSVFPLYVEDPPPFLFSSIRVERTPTRGLEAFNSSVAVAYPDRAPAVVGWSDKHRLVPFGEIVPFEGLLSRIGLEAIAASFTPAPDKSPVTFAGLPRASVQICYEIIFPGLTEGNPELILNQSNDAWFGHTTGPAQHAAIAAMRAVEEGIPVVRAAANGTSGTIDPWGRWTARIQADEEASLDVAVPRPLAGTPYGRLTNVILLVIGFLVTVFTIIVGRSGMRGADRNSRGEVTFDS